jgi:hypothetical protein
MAHILVCMLMQSSFCMADSLPVLRRSTLENEERWRLETELVGAMERNGAVLECTAETLQDLLIEAEMEPTVESLVQVLTTPCKADTPRAAIKELLLPSTDTILVSQDATFALIITPVRKGCRMEVFRDTAQGLTVQRIRK